MGDEICVSSLSLIYSLLFSTLSVSRGEFNISYALQTLWSYLLWLQKKKKKNEV